MSKIPRHADDREEAAFWDTHDSTDHVDDTQPVDVTVTRAWPPKAQMLLRSHGETARRLKHIPDQQHGERQ